MQGFTGLRVVGFGCLGLGHSASGFRVWRFRFALDLEDGGERDNRGFCTKFDT